MFKNLLNLPHINYNSFIMNSSPSCWYSNRRYESHWSWNNIVCQWDNCRWVGTMISFITLTGCDLIIVGRVTVTIWHLVHVSGSRRSSDDAMTTRQIIRRAPISGILVCEWRASRLQWLVGRLGRHAVSDDRRKVHKGKEKHIAYYSWRLFLVRICCRSYHYCTFEMEKCDRHMADVPNIHLWFSIIENNNWLMKYYSTKII